MASWLAVVLVVVIKKSYRLMPWQNMLQLNIADKHQGERNVADETSKGQPPNHQATEPPNHRASKHQTHETTTQPRLSWLRRRASCAVFYQAFGQWKRLLSLGQPTGNLGGNMPFTNHTYTATRSENLHNNKSIFITLGKYIIQQDIIGI